MYADMLSNWKKRFGKVWKWGLGVIIVCKSRYGRVGGGRSFFCFYKVSTLENGLFNIIP